MAEVAREMEIGQTIDLSIVKMIVHTCIAGLRDGDGVPKTRSLAIAVTKLEEAVMWIDEHLRLS